MEKVLRIGIIGLGKRWQKRYKPAFHALRRRFSVRVLCDQVQERAKLEAKQMACDVAAGPRQLLEREDVDAVLFLDAQWFRLWPLEQACQTGKPVFCCCSLESDDAHADSLRHQVRESRLPVVMEMVPRFAPVTARLRRLFETELGTPRLLLCEAVQPRKLPAPFKLTRSPDFSPVADLVGGAGIALLDWCAGLLGSEPLNVTARSLNPIGFSSLFLEFAGGRGVQITRRPEVVGRPAVRLQVVAERGSASVELPYQVSWRTKAGSHSQALRGQRPLAQLLLEHFRDVLEQRAAPEPTLEDAYRVLSWLRVASRSRDEGRLLSLTA
jgi:predicted dehydrogenase